jgi:hypothetical protein
MTLLANRKFIFGIIFFLLIVFTALEFIVYNEEVLLLICFCSFVVVTYRNLNIMVATMWDDTALGIKKELDSFKEIQKETLELLISKQKERKLVVAQVSDIFIFFKSELLVLTNLKERYLENAISLEVEEKLRLLLDTEASLSKLLLGRIITIWEEFIDTKLDASAAHQYRCNISECIHELGKE